MGFFSNYWPFHYDTLYNNNDYAASLAKAHTIHTSIVGHSFLQGKGVDQAPCVITEEQSGSRVPKEKN